MRAADLVDFCKCALNRTPLRRKRNRKVLERIPVNSDKITIPRLIQHFPRAALSTKEVISRNISNESGNWNLDRLIQKMGEKYHYNETPVDVMVEARLIALDGNRRVAAMKCMEDQNLCQAATQIASPFQRWKLNVPDKLP